MKSYKLLKDAEDHFVVDDGSGRPFRVAKSGLPARTMDKIRRFADGGQVDDPEVGGEIPVSPAVEPSDPGTVGPVSVSPEEAAGLLGVPMPSASPSGPTVPVLPPELATMRTAQSPDAPLIANIGTASTPPAPAQPAAQPLGQYAQAFKTAEQATRQKAAAETDLGKNIAIQIDAQQKQLADLAAAHETERAKYVKASDDSLAAYAKGEIDPNRLWHNAGTGKKITAAIGLILGGIGAGLTHGPNYALQVIDNAISRDIDAQKANLNKQGNLYRMNLERLHDSDSAYMLTRLEKLTAAQAMIEKVKAQAMGPQAQANATAALADIQMKRATVADQLGQRQAMAQFLGGGDVSQSTLAHLPPEEQSKMLNRRVMIAEDMPVIDRRTGKQAVDANGNPLTQRVATQRFGLDDDATKKARDALRENGEIQGKIRALEGFARQHPHGVLLDRAAVAQAKRLVNDLKLSWNQAQEGLNRVNENELDMVTKMVEDPSGIWSAFTGTTKGSLNDLRRMANEKHRAIEQAYLIPAPQRIR